MAELLLLRKENAELKANLINNGSSVDVTELNALRQQVESLKSENEALVSQLRSVEIPPYDLIWAYYCYIAPYMGILLLYSSLYGHIIVI